MKVIGTKQEIEWLLKSLANSCKDCPYFTECNQEAQKKVMSGDGKYRESCREYLNRVVEVEIE